MEMRQAQLISVVKGSVAKEDMSQVKREMKKIGIDVVFLEYEKNSAHCPVVHMMMGIRPSEKIEWTPTESEPTA